MVNKILSFIDTEFTGLHQAAFVLAFFAFLSQILALFRDRLLAHSFGAGEILDSYYAAFRIPDLLYVGIASFISATILVPFLAEYLEKGGKEDVEKFIGSIFSAFMLLLSGVAFVVFIFASPLVSFLFPGFEGEVHEQTVLLMRILLLSPLLLGISSVFGSISQVHHKFFPYAIAPVLYNFGIIIGIIFLAPSLGITGVALGVIIGACLHVLIQLPAVVQTGISLRFRSIDRGALKEVFTAALPRLVALSANQIALTVLVSGASLMALGSVSVFSFSFNLHSVPLTIIGLSYSVAAFPTLSRLFAKGQREEFALQMATALRHILFWSIPFVTFFIVLRAHIVRTILGSGTFDWDDTRLTAACLAFFVISLPAQALSLLFIRGYYAAGDTVRPFLVGVLSALVTIGLGFTLASVVVSSPGVLLFFEDLMRIEGVSGSSVVVLPFAYSVGALINAFLLWFIFARQFKEFSTPVLRLSYQVLGSSIVSGFTVYVVLSLLSPYFNLDTFWGVFGHGVIAGLSGLLVHALILSLWGNIEFRELLSALKRRFGATVIAPDQPEL